MMEEINILTESIIKIEDVSIFLIHDVFIFRKA